MRTLTTGVDWPVACIVDAAPTKSVMLHVQKIGRGLRVNPGFDDCLILDHSDNTLRLGFVTDIHRTALSDKDRPEVGRQEQSEPLLKECSQCSAIIPPKVNPCPSCGHERKAQAGVEEVEGDLVEVKKGKARRRGPKSRLGGPGFSKSPLSASGLEDGRRTQTARSSASGLVAWTMLRGRLRPRSGVTSNPR